MLQGSTAHSILPGIRITPTWQNYCEHFMTPLVLAVAYIVGVWIGSMLMRAGLLGCDLPEWLWVATPALLPLTPLLNGTPVVDDGPLRWPESAGFTRPREASRAA